MGKGCDGEMTAYCLHCYQSFNKLHIPGHEVFQMHGEEENDLSDAGGDSPSDRTDSELEAESDDEFAVREDAEGAEEEDQDEDYNNDESE